MRSPQLLSQAESMMLAVTRNRQPEDAGKKRAGTFYDSYRWPNNVHNTHGTHRLAGKSSAGVRHTLFPVELMTLRIGRYKDKRTMSHISNATFTRVRLSVHIAMQV